MKRQLILEDGTVFVGESFGSEREMTGEIVFTTGMTGYQETITDPSFYGQIVTLTYPLIGNYGINKDDFESITPVIRGLVVREVADYPSNWRNDMSIDEYLKLKNIPGISEIDTRKLTRIIRQHGTLKGTIKNMNCDVVEVVQSLQQLEAETDQVSQVSTLKPYHSPGRGYKIVLMDFGMKYGILRELNKRDCSVTVVPHDTTAEEILALKPDGVMLSNGPGDPKSVPQAMHAIQGLLGKVPIFGICLGHQLFALACGADTYKLKFGHRGSNHPIQDLETGKVFFTSQNHGYAVDETTVNSDVLVVTQRNVNDRTIEGLSHAKYDAFTVQYHPEASPGPEDTNGLFDTFINLIKQSKGRKKYA